MEFGKRLRELREAENVTQRQLADAVQMDYGYLSKMETGKLDSSPAVATIEKITSALGLSVGESDELHLLAGKLPRDIEAILIERPNLLQLVRKRGAFTCNG